MKPTKCPAKEKINETRKAKKDRGEERKRKVKVKTAVSPLNPAYAELRKLILNCHLDQQKAAKCKF